MSSVVGAVGNGKHDNNLQLLHPTALNKRREAASSEVKDLAEAEVAAGGSGADKTKGSYKKLGESSMTNDNEGRCSMYNTIVCTYHMYNTIHTYAHRSPLTIHTYGTRVHGSARAT